MQCAYPVTIKNPSVSVYFDNSADGTGYVNPITGEYLPKYISVPCGRCIICQDNRRNEWATRMELESRASLETWFVTLTYGPDNCPDQLQVDDLQRFFKRLRKVIKCRYFACGEYGDLHQRPHYHAIIWLNSHCELLSDIINEKWGAGFVKVDPANYDRFRYVAKYCVKYQDSHPEGKQPPFAIMSRRPGISFPYFSELRNYYHDFITLSNGNSATLPGYLLSKLPDLEQLRIKRDKREFASANKELPFNVQESRYQALRNSLIRKYQFKYAKYKGKFASNPSQSKDSEL